jgi:uncharacterized protein (TIGR03083 family)
MEHISPSPIDTRQLFRPLNDKLLELLHSLTPEDWTRPTVAKLWNVKDVAAHLLDGNIRAMSIQRDRYFGETAPASSAYGVMVAWLNGLNADWVKASRRISPSVLVWLHEMTSEPVTTYFESQDLFDEAVFSVGWMGEERSVNWMHIAREYTEKWHHQQQIREAIGREGIMTREFFFPLIDTFLRALPHAMRNTDAAIGATIRVNIRTDAGGDWFLAKTDNGWSFAEKPRSEQYAATVSLPPDIAWKLFSKSIRPRQIAASIEITGDRDLAANALQMVSVMA